MQSYKDLEIYRLAHELAVEIHEMTMSLPNFELFEEGSQIWRSSKAIVSNIVEGFGRKRYPQDYVRFLVFAHSSCDETREHLELLYETQSITDGEKFKRFSENYQKLSKMINKLIQAIKKTWNLWARSLQPATHMCQGV